MSRRSAPEARLQKHIAQWCWAALAPGVVWSCFPSGGGGKVRGAQLKAMGLLPGVSDLLFMWPGGIGWCELKSPAGRMTPEQVDFASRVQALGHKFALVRGIDQLRAALAEWQVPTRESKDTRITLNSELSRQAVISPKAASLFRPRISIKP